MVRRPFQGFKRESQPHRRRKGRGAEEKREGLVFEKRAVSFFSPSSSGREESRSFKTDGRRNPNKQGGGGSARVYRTPCAPSSVRAGVNGERGGFFSQTFRSENGGYRCIDAHPEHPPTTWPFLNDRGPIVARPWRRQGRTRKQMERGYTPFVTRRDFRTTAERVDNGDKFAVSNRAILKYQDV